MSKIQICNAHNKAVCGIQCLGASNSDSIYIHVLDYYLPIPEPKFDFVEISLYSTDHKKPLDELQALFGKPESWSKIKGHLKFSNGVFLRKYNTHFNHIIALKADEDTFSALATIYPKFPPRPNGKPAALLHSAEVAFDFPLPELGYPDAEKILCAFAALAVPKNHYATISDYYGPLQEKKNGVVNGGITYYFCCRRENEKKVFVMIEDPSWKAKLYLKKFSGIWHLRCEMTLKHSTLNRHGLIDIPHDSRVNTNSRQLSILDFFDFKEFDWKKFRQAAANTQAFKSNRAARMMFNLLRSYARRNPLLRDHMTSSSHDLRVAREISKRLKSSRLRTQIGRGVFCINKVITLG